MNPLNYIKEHPYMSGGFVVGAIILFMLLRGGGGSSAASGNADLNGIYAAQAAASTAEKQINAQAGAQQASIAGQIQALTIQSQTAQNLAGVNANVELAKINATQQITDLANTLTANVAMKNISGQVDIAQIQSNTTIAQSNDLATILTTQAYHNAGVAKASIEAAGNAKSSCWFFC